MRDDASQPTNSSFTSTGSECDEGKESDSSLVDDGIYNTITQYYLSQNLISEFVEAEKEENTAVLKISDCYVNLALVDSAHQEQWKNNLLTSSQNNDSHIDYLQNAIDIDGANNSDSLKFIGVNSLFNFRDNDPESAGRKIVIYGNAGIGKSTLLHSIAYRWAEQKEPWAKEISYIFWLPLRELTSSWVSNSGIDKEPLAHFIYYSCMRKTRNRIPDNSTKDYHIEEIKRILDSTKNKVYLLLDGYDEVAHLHSPQNNYRAHIILNAAFAFPNIILTSRPNSIDRSIRESFLSKATLLQNVGLLHQNINEYIGKFFRSIDREGSSERLKEDLIRYIECHKEVMSLVKTPINLYLICTIWTDSLRAKYSEGISLTSLYSEVVYSRLKKYIKNTNSSENIENFSNEELDNREESKDLEKIAYEAINQKKAIFSGGIFAKLGIGHTNIENIMRVGLLKTIGEGKHYREKQHYFIHFTSEEFIAAKYIARMLNSESPQETEEFIRQHKYNRIYERVLYFTSGLLNSRSEEAVIKKFWNILCEYDSTDLRMVKQVALFIRCLEENRADSRVPNIDALISYIRKFILSLILANPAQKKDLDYLLNQLEQSPYITKRIELIKKLKDILSYGSNQKYTPQQQERALDVIKKLAVGDSETAHYLLDRLQNTIKFNIPKYFVIDALGAVGSGLSELHDRDICIKIATALSEELPAPPVVDEPSAIAAIKAITNIPTSNTSLLADIKKKLTILLNTGAVNVEKAAIKALADIGKGDNSVLDVLLEKLGSHLTHTKEWQGKRHWVKSALKEAIITLSQQYEDNCERVWLYIYDPNSNTILIETLRQLLPKIYSIPKLLDTLSEERRNTLKQAQAAETNPQEWAKFTDINDNLTSKITSTESPATHTLATTETKTNSVFFEETYEVECYYTARKYNQEPTDALREYLYNKVQSYSGEERATYFKNAILSEVAELSVRFELLSYILRKSPSPEILTILQDITISSIYSTQAAVVLNHNKLTVYENKLAILDIPLGQVGFVFTKAIYESIDKHVHENNIPSKFLDDFRMQCRGTGTDQYCTIYKSHDKRHLLDSDIWLLSLVRKDKSVSGYPRHLFLVLEGRNLFRQGVMVRMELVATQPNICINEHWNIPLADLDITLQKEMLKSRKNSEPSSTGANSNNHHDHLEENRDYFANSCAISLSQAIGLITEVKHARDQGVTIKYNMRGKGAISVGGDEHNCFTWLKDLARRHLETEQYNSLHIENWLNTIANDPSNSIHGSRTWVERITGNLTNQRCCVLS